MGEIGLVCRYAAPCTIELESSCVSLAEKNNSMYNSVLVIYWNNDINIIKQGKMKYLLSQIGEYFKSHPI